MKNLRLLLLGLLTPLLCFGLSFASSPYVLQVNGCDCILNMSNCLSQLDREYITNTYSISPVCFNFSFEDYYHIFSSVNFQWNYSNWNYSFDFNSPYKSFWFCDSDINRLLNSFDNIHFQWNVNMCQELPMTISFYDSSSFGWDCSYFEDQYLICSQDLSTCQSNLSGANSTLNTCQSDLSSCQNNGSNCDTLYWVCVENLSGCISDKESLTNYNEALSTQLNECLNNQGSWSNLSWLILNNNSLFWYLDDSLLSLPINNNLFLPLGYQGALDSWNVLYIKAIDEEEPENYYITPEDKVSIIDILSYIFVFFLWIGIIFSLIKLFKKLFTH